MIIREIKPSDFERLIFLYSQLKPDVEERVSGEKLRAVFSNICRDSRQRIYVCEEGGRLVSSCVLVLVENLTHGARPYALVENVVTDKNYRKRGYAAAVLKHACGVAGEYGCYKVMLMTGAKDEGTLRFYERAGFNRNDKTAFIRWLDEKNVTE